MNSTTICKVGAGLRACHYPRFEESPHTQLTWFEAISENYMDSQGRPRAMLRFMREHYPLSLHGVSMGLASTGQLDFLYLRKLKALVDEIQPFNVSDHLCWTGQAHNRIHDLLPFPLNEKSLRVVAEHVCEAQEVLKRPLLVENVSTYVTFHDNEMTEWDFLNELTHQTGCFLLLDINNIHVSAMNHGFDPLEYLDAIPPEKVRQIHLAGFTDLGNILFDTHSKPVHPPVWDLFSYYIQKAPHIPFMIEWDEDIPSFERLEEEALKAKKIWHSHHEITEKQQRVAAT